MQILFVISRLVVEAGGTTTIACGMAGALAVRGHQVTIATLECKGTPAETRGAIIERFPPDNAGSSLGASRPMRTWLQKHITDFDVVHIHGIWQHPGHYAAAAARKTAVPYLVSPYGMLDCNSLAMGRRWAKHLAWWLWDGPMTQHAAAVHCENRAEYRVSPWIHGKRIAVVGNGVPAEIVAEPVPAGTPHDKPQSTSANPGQLRTGSTPDWDSRSIALFLGRIHPKKGLDRFLPAWKSVLAKHPDAALVVAGTGEPAYIESLHALCRAEGIDHAVVWVGQLVGRDKWAALVDADVFVLPSYQEGFSLSITEAMAAACPVVITRECNFDDVATTNAGVIVDGGDMRRFAAEVSTLLADAPRRRLMGENGRRLVRERYTWSAIAEQMERVYTAIIAGKPLPEDCRPQ